MSGFAYRIDDHHVEQIEVKGALACGAGFVWVHLNDTAEHAQTWLRDTAKLPDFAIDALVTAESRPRYEDMNDGGFLNLRGRTDDEVDTTDVLASIRIWGTAGRVVSVTRKHLVALDKVVAQVRAGRVRDPGDLIAAFATEITADLDPVVGELGDRLDDCEQELGEGSLFDQRRIVTRVRSEAITFRRFLSPQRAALERLVQAPGDWLQADDRAHLSTAADRAARMAEEVEAIRERASLIHDTLSDLRAEQLDTRGLIISIAAMVFLPLTFITGLYGMNVAGLPYAEKPWAFDAIAAACLIIALATVAFFVQRHWVGRSGG